MDFYVGGNFIGNGKLFLNLERKNMSIDKTIENMEATLKKKKEERRVRQEAKLRKLKERVEVKMRNISKLSEEVSAMESECAEIQSDLNIAGTETKTEVFTPDGTEDTKKKVSENKPPPAKKK
jgi:hypothetical protein